MTTMTKVANVVYSYSPKNVDELELKVGDKIEVIGFEEEGWLKGRLRGRIGVFPSNFVEVIEADTDALSQQTNLSLSQSTLVSPMNKPNIFGKTSKISSSSNSLNSNISNSNNYISNTNNTSSNGNSNNNNLVMNNTQHQENLALTCADDPVTVVSSERRSKPIRGVGYGDIFAAGTPTSNNTNPTSDRLSTSQLVTTLQKQIPKKPPPPTPNHDNGNANPADRAPALPPKPANQFSSHLQHTRPLPQNPPPAPQQSLQQQHKEHQPREQAIVRYTYDPSQEDELALEVGDIIDIIDKNIEDVGWWKGELRGKIGVFPDNFVESIKTVPSVASPISQDWNASRAQSMSAQSAALGSGVVDPPAHATSSYTPNAEGKLKSVFATTPKGFSKELESNLEKLNSPASFLSLKRNKLQQMHSEAISEPAPVSNETGGREIEAISLTETSPKKLNNITANRAKGPSRRPPSNIINKRLQADNIKREPNGEDAPPPASSLSANAVTQPSNLDSQTPSLASAQHAIPSLSQTATKPSEMNPLTPVKWSPSLENVLGNQSTTPKTSQRNIQQPLPVPQKAPQATAAPPWMAEFRKANERRRDGPTAGTLTSGTTDEESVPVSRVSELGSSPPSNLVPSSTDTVSERKSSVQSLRGAYNNQATTPTTNSVRNLSSRYSGEFSTSAQPSEPERVGLSNNTTAEGNITSTDSSPSSRIGSVARVSPSSKNHEPVTVSSIHGLSHARNGNGNENGNSNPTVPSNVGKTVVHSAAGKGMNSQPVALDNSNINSATMSPTPQKPASNIKDQREKSPEKASVVDQHNPIHEKAPVLSEQQYDNLVKQISKSVFSEISELREEVTKLKNDFHGLSELKSVLEVMKLELKECQSATENQKRYIKELVNNLADERKKIASMQTEIDRTLK